MAIPEPKNVDMYKKGYRPYLGPSKEHPSTCFSGVVRVKSVAYDHLGPFVLEEHVGNHQEVFWSWVNKQGCVLRNTAITERVGTPPVVGGLAPPDTAIGGPGQSHVVILCWLAFLWPAPQ